MHARATIGFGFTSGWLKNGAKTVNQSLSEVIINQRNYLITFDTQLKIALFNEIGTARAARPIFSTSGVIAFWRRRCSSRHRFLNSLIKNARVFTRRGAVESGTFGDKSSQLSKRNSKTAHAHAIPAPIPMDHASSG